MVAYFKLKYTTKSDLLFLIVALQFLEHMFCVDGTTVEYMIIFCNAECLNRRIMT